MRPLPLDNTGTNVANRLATTAGLFLTSGTLNVLGNATATTYTAGPLANSATAGVNTIRVTPAAGGGVPTLQLANVPSGTNTAFSTRLSTFSVLRFEAGSGVIGTNARITFAGTPGLGANGLLANATTPTSTSGTFGYALAADPSGTDFATWNAANGIVKAGATQTAATLAAVTGTDNTSRVQYNPAAGDTAAGTLTVGSLRITPATAGLTTAFGASNLVTNALMLDGVNDFTLSGTGLFGANGTRYIHVNSPAAALTTGLSVVNGTNPSTFAGPGFLILNGTAVQAAGNATAGASSRFDLMGGTVRGTDANLGFTAVVTDQTNGNDAFAAFNFRGGVIEIAGGANGTGAAADFRRQLGAVDGSVRWEGGGGGFSAFGSAASVNLGGAATPTALTWGTTANFVQNGQPLLFGSPRSNAPVVFLNPLQLDTGTAGAYALREVRVVAGAGGDRAVLAGNVTGSATTDLIKTGAGTLALTAAGNAYNGNTFVQAGTLIAGAGGTGAGRLFVGGGAALYPGTLTTGLEPRPAPTTVINSQFDLAGGATLQVRVTGAVTTASVPSTSGAPGTANSQLSAGAGGITLGNGVNYVVDLTGTTGLTAGQPYSFRIGTSTGSNVIVGTAGTFTFVDSGVDISATVSGPAVQLNGTGVFLTFTPVPEPATVLAVAAAGLGGLRLVRRRVRGS